LSAALVFNSAHALTTFRDPTPEEMAQAQAVGGSAAFTIEIALKDGRMKSINTFDSACAAEVAVYLRRFLPSPVPRPWWRFW
jgi:hypothetical protein